MPRYAATYKLLFYYYYTHGLEVQHIQTSSAALPQLQNISGNSQQKITFLPEWHTTTVHNHQRGN